MVVKKINIKKFRGFENVEFELGSNITLIAGQNGTQKSTLLGMLSQPFTITDKDHPLYDEKPLTGGTYKSSFQDKFKLSTVFDQAKQHEWTLYFNNQDFFEDPDGEGYTLESIPRDKKTGTIRFWRKGTREKGTGYIQLPVIFLSLKRLLPIGEDTTLTTEMSIELSEQEKLFFSEAYNSILRTNSVFTEINYLKSSSKETLGVSTETYDWNSNSAGQDNVSKLLLAIISFKRLKELHGENYKGGVLAIDEIDAALFPGSQIKLFEKFLKFSSKFNIQLVVTTHSLTLLKEALKVQNNRLRKDQVKVVYLRRFDGKIKVQAISDYDQVEANLNVSLGTKKYSPKIDIFTEDSEAKDYLKAILGRKFKYLNFVDSSLGCGNLIQLAIAKVPIFMHPNSIVILDGDAQSNVSKKRLKNFLCLPGSDSPERELAKMLAVLSDEHEFWTMVNVNYNKQVCFTEYSLEDINSCRIKAKDWYQKQLKSGVWGGLASKVYKCLFEETELDKADFLKRFESIYEDIYKQTRGVE